jgi:hypothetical protein
LYALDASRTPSRLSASRSGRGSSCPSAPDSPCPLVVSLVAGAVQRMLSNGPSAPDSPCPLIVSLEVGEVQRMLSNRSFPTGQPTSFEVSLEVGGVQRMLSNPLVVAGVCVSLAVSYAAIAPIVACFAALVLTPGGIGGGVCRRVDHSCHCCFSRVNSLCGRDDHSPPSPNMHLSADLCRFYGYTYIRMYRCSASGSITMGAVSCCSCSHVSTSSGITRDQRVSHVSWYTYRRLGV